MPSFSSEASIAAVSIKDIEDIFSAGLAPLLLSFERLEHLVKDLGKDPGKVGRVTAHLADSKSQRRPVKQKSSPFCSEEPSPLPSRQLSSEQVCVALGINPIDVAICDAWADPSPLSQTKNVEFHMLEQIKIEFKESDSIETPTGSQDREPDTARSNGSNNRTSHISSSGTQSEGSHRGWAHTISVKREMAKLHGAGGNHTHSKVINTALHALSWFHSIEEPPRSGPIFKIVSSRKFETLCMFVIFLNSMFLAFSADWEMKNVSEEKTTEFAILSIVFNGFFVLELSLKLMIHGLYYFVNADAGWNVFDFFLVMASVLDQVVTSILPASGGGAGNIGFMRILRLMRLAKVLRAFRTVKFFKELSNLAEGAKRSLGTLFWSISLLALMTFVFGLMFLQGLTEYLKIGKPSAEQADQVNQDFGSLIQTMISLYMAVTGGNDWSIYYDTAALAGPLYAAMFLLFTFCFIFALFNILTGMLVEKAVSVAVPDRNDLVLQKRQKDREDADELLRMCKILDQDSDGTISRDEFDRMLQNSIFASYMSALGLEVTDTELFYSTAAGSSEADDLAVEDFVEACVHMKGNATRTDMKRQLLETSTLMAQLQKADQNTSTALEHMEVLNLRVGKLLDRQDANLLSPKLKLLSPSSRTALKSKSLAPKLKL